jgi:hypothetical protein
MTTTESEIREAIRQMTTDQNATRYKFSYDLLAKAGDDALGEDIEHYLYRDYSGRGMNGDTCFGLIFANVNDVVLVFVRLAQVTANSVVLTQAVVDLAEAMRVDNTGTSLITYFPQWDVA